MILQMIVLKTVMVNGVVQHLKIIVVSVSRLKMRPVQWIVMENLEAMLQKMNVAFVIAIQAMTVFRIVQVNGVDLL